jgi:creatinine amidohydrolase
LTAYRLERLAPAEIEARLAAQPLLVLPLGTIEWHSHHLPVGLDSLVAEGVAARLADRCDALLAPVSYWAIGGVPFPYTLNLPTALVEPLYTALFEQFAAMGVRLIVALTGHFGRDQTAALKRAAWRVMEHSPATLLPLTPYDLVTDLWEGDHAGPGESSLLWALDPALVRLDAVPADAPLPGVIGPDPRGRATQAWGAHLIDQIVERGAALAQRLLAADAAECERYRAALGGAVEVLEAINHLRATQPPAAVPPLVTPAYTAYCQALAAGDFAAALAHAQAKLTDLHR